MPKLDRPSQEARNLRSQALQHGIPPSELAPTLQFACDRLNLCVLALPSDDPLLAGSTGVLDREMGAIWLNAALTGFERQFTLAHEIGHAILHDAQEPCCQDLLNTDGGLEHDLDSLLFGSELVGYDPRQRREVEANRFALELIAPSSDLLAMRMAGLSPGEITQRMGVPRSLVLRQLAAGFQASSAFEEPAGDRPPADPPPLDSSQREVVTQQGGPTLVVAGPGSGKTHSLVQRVVWLLEKGVRADRILLLTYSNKAADEIRERIGRVSPRAAGRMWISTFHSFGLDLVRRFWTELGYPTCPQLLTTETMHTFLEANLNQLPLEWYANIRDPLQGLRPALEAINKANDRLISPQEFALAAQAQADSEDGHKLSEAAAIYQAWIKAKLEGGVVEFGDLINEPIRLFNARPDICSQVADSYEHILIDEYQDSNKACDQLIRCLRPEGNGLWVVGDSRQAIYEFRGANPENVIRFSQNYPGAEIKELEVNYRSAPAIVSLAQTLAGSMESASGEPPQWRAARTDVQGTIGFQWMTSKEQMDDALFNAIQHNCSQGYSLGDQAILVKKRKDADRIAATLSSRGVASYRLGNPLDHPIARELLSWLSFMSEPTSPAAFRLANLLNWPTDLRDRILTLEREEQLTGREALSRLALDDTLPSARAAHEAVEAALEGVTGFEPGLTCLLALVFSLRLGVFDSLSINAPDFRMTRAAVGALISLAARTPLPVGNQPARQSPLRFFLRTVRQAYATLSADDPEAAPPEGEANRIRILTMHSAKGLEFPVVYLPDISDAALKGGGIGEKPPLPESLFGTDGDRKTKEQEELRRLAFVAVTRAKDILWIGCAGQNGSPPQSALAADWLIEGLALSGIDIPPKPEKPPKAEKSSAERADRAGVEVTYNDLKTYSDCPRKYYYRRVANLPSAQDSPVASRAMNQLYEIAAKLLAGEEADAPVQALIESLRLEWKETGAEDSAFGEWCRTQVERMLGQLAQHAESQRNGRVQTFSVTVGSDTVNLGEVLMRREGNSISVQRIQESADLDNILRHFLVAAVRERYPDADIEASGRNIKTGRQDTAKGDKSMRTPLEDRLASARDGIASREFHPTPGAPCATCPYLFICPTL